MRQSSSPSLHLSSVSRSPYVSCNPATTRFGEIEKMFNCGGCMIAEDELALSPVVTVLYHQASYGDEYKFDFEESKSTQSKPTGNSTSSSHNSTKHTDSDSTQGTQSMSQSDDDDISVDSHGDSEREQEEETPTSILRRKGKLGTNVVTNNTTTDRVRVRFATETKFPDPNEIPSPRRKKDPRFTQKQREEYTTMHNYYQSTVHQQLNLSSLLIYEYN
mmetsp:Transcript_46341/g.51804  ORF Transcript_46341/g.51804 Transcript_46341/m.51804 type:complete len:218 (-) Transcript_46341:1058-1711(-)